MLNRGATFPQPLSCVFHHRNTILPQVSYILLCICLPFPPHGHNLTLLMITSSSPRSHCLWNARRAWSHIATGIVAIISGNRIVLLGVWRGSGWSGVASYSNASCETKSLSIPMHNFIHDSYLTLQYFNTPPTEIVRTNSEYWSRDSILGVVDLRAHW
jgi:hypothetical protein